MPGEVVLASGVHADVVLRPADGVASTSLVVRKVARASLAPHSLQTEATALAACAHPNVVELLASSPTSLTLPLLAPLTSLTYAVPSHALWTHVAHGLLAGLAHVHAAGWAHRDVKPGNVMLDWAGGVKLIDFGIARRLASLGSGVDGGKGADAVGSGPYRAPEVLFSPIISDDRALDTWSAALVLAEFFRPRQACPDPLADSASDSGPEQDDGSGDASDSDSTDSSWRPSSSTGSRHPTSASGLGGRRRRVRRGQPRGGDRRDWDDRIAGAGPRRPLFDATFGDLGLTGSIFRLLGTPTTDSWPSFESLPDAGKIHFHPRHPRPLARALPALERYAPGERAAVLRVLAGLLVLEPARRASAAEARDLVGVEPGWEGEMSAYLAGAQERVEARIAGAMGGGAPRTTHM